VFLVEQQQTAILHEHQCSPRLFVGFLWLNTWIVFCRSLIAILSFFFWRLCCLSFFHIRFWLSLWYLKTFLMNNILIVTSMSTVRMIRHKKLGETHHRRQTVWGVMMMVYLQINTWAFPYWPGYHPETPILTRDAVEGQYGSRDDNQANIEMPTY
jgi:hypothetical protein